MFVQRELNADNVDMVIIVLVGSMSACLGLLLLMPIVKRLPMFTEGGDVGVARLYRMFIGAEGGDVGVARLAGAGFHA